MPNRAIDAGDKVAGVALDAAARVVEGLADFLTGGSASPKPAPDPEQQRRNAFAREERAERKSANEVTARQNAENDKLLRYREKAICSPVKR